MPNAALVPTAVTRIPSLFAVLDGFPETRHLLETAKADEPIEDGTSVTDHANVLPEVLRLTGWVSDFDGGRRPRSAWAAIRRMNNAEEPISIVTEWGSYREMLLTRAEGSQAGRGCRVQLEFRKVTRVGNPQSSLPSGTTSGSAADRPGGVNRGRVSLPSI